VKTSDIEYDRNKDQLTFKPNLGMTKQINEKVVEERGYTSPEKKSLLMPAKKQSRPTSSFNVSP